MTTARKQILSETEAVYHCVSRCVRRAYLCGEDALTGKNYDYRKNWVRDRLEFLSEVFTIDVLGYALMSTHGHKMLRTRPDLMIELSNEEVARRWYRLYPRKGIEPGSKWHKELILETAKDPKRIKTLRQRLCNISWFMKSLNEFIARKANKEDGCKGRFWEGRFKCQRLCDEAAVLSCAVYIDLNPIRAKVAKTPEESKYTGAYERIHAMSGKQVEPNLWLSPIQDRGDRRGFLRVTFFEYLEILDSTGRELKHGKRGKIPSELSPILERLGVKPRQWLLSCQMCGRGFASAIGSKESLRKLAASQGKAWLKGTRLAERAFI